MKVKVELGELIKFMRSFMEPKELERLDREAREHQSLCTKAHDRTMAALQVQWSRYEEGGDWRAAMRERMSSNLEHQTLTARHCHSGLLYSHVSIMACGAGGRHCPACAALDGKTYTFEEVANNPPLPPEDCTCKGFAGAEPGFCLCMYQPAFDDELPES